jgi:hypothetical protein
MVRDGAVFGGVGRDVSPGGIAVDVRGPVELGEALSVEFDTPDGDVAVRCTGLVRSLRTMSKDATRIGFEFHNLEPKTRRRLADWVRTRLSGPPVPAEDRWAGLSDIGEASRVSDGLAVYRWTVPFTSLWPEVVRVLAESTAFFVPFSDPEAREGEHVYVEIVPPESHAVLKLQAEVTWVARDGLGLRHVGLTTGDRAFLAGITAHFVRETAKYR